MMINSIPTIIVIIPITNPAIANPLKRSFPIPIPPNTIPSPPRTIPVIVKATVTFKYNKSIFIQTNETIPTIARPTRLATKLIIPNTVLVLVFFRLYFIIN